MVARLSALGLIASACLVAAHPASELAIAVAKQQFVQARITTDLLGTFDPVGLATINYTSSNAGVISNGKQVAVADVQSAPLLKIRGTAAAEATQGGPFNVTDIKYTVIMIDLRQPGNNQSTGTVRHYLEHGLTYGENNDHTVTLNHNNEPITPYGGPAPPPGSGPHRYTWLVFAEPADFTPVANLSTPNTPVGIFNFTAWYQASRLSAPIAGVYFEATNDSIPLTVSVAPTSAVVTSTLPAWTTAQTLVDSGHGGSTPAPSSSSRPAGAGVALKVPVVAALTAVIGMAAGVWTVL